MIELFDDQADLIEKTAQSMRKGNKRVLMQAATGSGKTIMATEILRRAQAKGTKTWFVVPRKQLLRQTSTTYEQFQIPNGLIASGHKYVPKQQNYICSLQTLPRRLEKLQPPSMAIIDECHFGGSQLDQVVKWLTEHGTYIIGLSATPKKHNGDGMNQWFDDIVLGPTIKSLIDANRLAGYRVFAPNTPDLSSVAQSNGDYAQKGLQKFMKDHGAVLIGDAVDTYKAHAKGKLGLTFCVSIEESKRTAQAFKDKGVPAEHMDGETDDDVRRFIIERFANRQILQICSVDLMTFGFDLAAQVGRDVPVECMSDLAATKSEAKQLQKWGRVLRRDDQPHLIFDHVGNVFEHGMPCDERQWTLEGKKKRVRKEPQERDIDVKHCPKCYFCHPIKPSCPNCGHVYPVQARKIEKIEGELSEVMAVEKKEKRMEVGMAKSYADLLKIANERGYKPYWAKLMAKKKGII